MPKKGANISLKGYDDLFSTEEGRIEAQQERVQEIPLSELHPFEGHPFRVVDDEDMEKTVESIKEYGVLTPAIVRPDPDGGYEIISGHRRHHASELAGKETMPVIVRDMDDDAAIILMVDSNLQRESILPSERAYAFKMKLDAIKHQGQTCGQVGHKSRDSLSDTDSGRQIQRYIRLTELIPELLEMVDNGQIKFNPAVELSYLAREEQQDFLSAMDYAQTTPSLSQAQRIKKLAQEGECMYPQQVQIGCELEDLQATVGGDIEAVYPFSDPVAIICNDEGMVHAANLTPDQLSELLRMFASDMTPKPETINAINEEEMQNEN